MSRIFNGLMYAKRINFGGYYMALEVVQQMRDIAHQKGNDDCFKKVNVPRNQFNILAIGDKGVEGIAAQMHGARWQDGILASLIFVDESLQPDFLTTVAAKSGYVLLDLCRRDLDSEIRRCVQDMWGGDSSMLPPSMVEAEYLGALTNRYREVTGSSKLELHNMPIAMPGMRKVDEPPMMLVHAEESVPFLQKIIAFNYKMPVAVATTQQRVIAGIRGRSITPAIIYYADRPL